MRARNSSVIRICHGAPGVTCSPAMKPSASQRWIVEVLRLRICAALRIVATSPSGGSQRGEIFEGRARPTLAIDVEDDAAASLACQNLLSQLEHFSKRLHLDDAVKQGGW